MYPSVLWSQWLPTGIGKANVRLIGPIPSTSRPLSRSLAVTSLGLELVISNATRAVGSNQLWIRQGSHQAGYGYELIFQDQSIRIGIGLQGQRLTERTHVKRLDARAPVRDEFPDSVDLQTGAPIAESSGLQTNNIGFPGFDYDGWLWATMFQIGIGL